MPNHLAAETSPYLRQHANNPVDWYAWGDEALAKATREDKPILLSVGYSACHWCHVMERESFEDPETARIMNERFVSIKVDREERPDVDAVYMQAVQAMTGRGGWPLTVFLTPDGRPFYGGTYFPPTDQHGMPGFPRVLEAVSEAYKTKRDDILKSADQLVEYIQRNILPAAEDVPMSPDLLKEAATHLTSEFDAKLGGFGEAPKFPQSMVLEFLLRSHHRSGEAQWWEMATLTLDRMALGGMYDQLGGGFHRYSTDQYWLVPHFEKMLYDNALLARVYLHAYQGTDNVFYKRICEEILDYVVREMHDPAGGFYSTQDADSEGEEGKFFVWTVPQIKQALGDQDGNIVAFFYGATNEGNWEGKNVLWVPMSPESIAQQAGVSLEQLSEALLRGRNRLLEARSKRVPPARDDKVQTSWNGLMLTAFAEAGVVLERDDYLKVAEANADFVLGKMRANGRLLHTYKDGLATVPGYLEDYAYYAEGLLSLYQATFTRRWLDEARALTDDILRLFYEPMENVLYDVGKDQAALIVRPRNLFDNATPAGGSVAATLMLQIAEITGDSRYREVAGGLIRPLREQMAAQPLAFGNWLSAADFYLSTVKEIAIVGPRSNPATKALLRVVHGRFIPSKVVAGYDPRKAKDAEGVALLEGREQVSRRPTAYVCEAQTCKLPANDPDTLAKQLEGV